MRSLPAVSDLREIFEYEPETGALRWKKKINYFIKVGKVAGSRTKTGVNVGVGGVVVPARRVIWAMHYGEWPNQNVRHKNKDRYDTRIENLYLASGKSGRQSKIEKEVYSKHDEIPISKIKEYFSLDCYNRPIWIKKAGPKVKVGSLAGRDWGGVVFIGFKGFIIDARHITYALLNGEWPKD